MSTNEDFNKIANALMKTYQDEMHEYLTSKKTGELMDSDVIVMIMNLTIGIGSNIYYSLKQILPSTPIDFDFAKAKIINSFVDSFEKIKSLDFSEGMQPLTIEQMKEIEDNGFTIVTFKDGSQKRVSKEDIRVKRDETDSIIEGAKKESIYSGHEKKLILPH